MILTERETERGRLVTVCDEGVLGETFENGDVSLTVTEEFYGGESATEADVAAALARAAVGNLVGSRAVEFAVEEGVVAEENVLDVGETVHAQFLRL
jgi:hypothetical protein